jgi:hypothetical protein
MLFGLYRAQLGENKNLDDVGELIGTIEEEILVLLNPSIPRSKRDHEEEKRQALKDIRASGPIKVTSLVPPTQDTKIKSTFLRIREKVLGEDARRQNK